LWIRGKIKLVHSKESMMKKTQHRIHHCQPILVFPKEVHKNFIIGHADITGFLGLTHHPRGLVVLPNWTIETDGKKWRIQTDDIPLIIPIEDVDAGYNITGDHELQDIRVSIHRRKFLYTGTDTHLIATFKSALAQCQRLILQNN